MASLTGDDRRPLTLALAALRRLVHRGGRASDGMTGDGAGVLTRLPHGLFLREAARLGAPALSPGQLAVGVLFLRDRSPEGRKAAETAVAQACSEETVDYIGWRDVPANPDALGEWARSTMPRIAHILLARRFPETDEAFAQRLYRLRRRLERIARRTGLELYVCSLSARTIVYKALLMADQLERFYPDLTDPDYRTPLAVFHQRYSTNTTPSWERAQPFRLLAHNGEINTLAGNVNWWKAREADLDADCWRSLGRDLFPIIDETGSDSSILDSVMELLVLSGRSLPHAVTMLVPEAWEGMPDIDPALRDYYRFHRGLMEPWDGPAGLVFTDGQLVGAALDRNGLRPMRFAVTDDGLVFAASEAGCVPVPAASEVRLGRLGPGQLIVVDVDKGVWHEDRAIKHTLSRRRPYSRWLAAQRISLSTWPTITRRPVEDESDAGLLVQQAAFGYTSEELTVILRPMAETAKEPVGSMGDDTPHAVLSLQSRPLFHYFKQRFAEVTNPPLDHLREGSVFSLTTLLGPRRNLLEETPDQAHLIELPSPVMRDHELERLRAAGRAHPGLRCETVSLLFDPEAGPGGLLEALDRVCAEAEAAVDRGAGIIVLSDRGVSPSRAPIPSLLATGAVHHHLIRRGKRMRASLVVETGEAREVHHVATLLGYGASAVNPYLALAAVAAMARTGRLSDRSLTPEQAQKRYRKALEQGLLKVMSRMGISTVDAYTGAQIFEAIGLNQEVIDRCFPGTPSPVSGNGFREIAELVLAWHRRAFGPLEALDAYGFYKYKKGGEFHEFHPEAVRALHQAVGLKKAAEAGDYDEYRRFSRLVHAQPSQLRDLLTIRSDRSPIPLDEVEPEDSIVRRFSTANMSLGALSPEAHRTLAVAMNRLGARAGSGEGGEDPDRYGTEANSNVKQVASGRFGVTPAYLASAVEIQIKMAQGSKPGEGGQIPGHKVTEYIARLRHAVPGAPLISPPPHHDIYSIEDLAQLIYDLKQANPRAEVSVKLVAQSGVGIIAAGVAKGGADAILISGHSGGTGASPLNAIKHAGLPWEIGLAETQQALLANGLRERVAVRVDGGLKTGRDVVVAALLGADEFSFGTAAMIAEGCIMARVCHNNTCPAGVATQDPELRRKFPGSPETVMRYFRFVAREIRELLAQMGYRSLDEIIGRTDLLQQEASGHPAAVRLDLSRLLAGPQGADDQPRRRVWRRNPLPQEQRLDDQIIEACRPALEDGRPVQLELPVSNGHRAVGATLAWEIARRFGDRGLPEGSVQALFRGTAGQSFGAFCTNGMHLTVVGAANDYVGKGMAGGEIVLRPAPEATFATHENVICGNAVLYGATGGEFYAAGRAGERFAVRNSGALAVIEGTGDHGCEYMTGGIVVVLGSVGYNFGAGMTGGEAFVLVDGYDFGPRLNRQLVAASYVSPDDAKRLRAIVAKHHQRTGSPRAADLLADWDAAWRRFVRVAPISESRVQVRTQEGAMAS